MPSNERAEDKFEFFYRPYNYICNLDKYISYDGYGAKGQTDPFKLYKELMEEEHYLDTYIKSVGLEKTRS